MAQLIDLSVKLVKLLVLIQDRLDLVLEVITTQIEGDKEFLVFPEEVVENTGNEVFMRHVLEGKLKAASQIFILHAEVCLVMRGNCFTFFLPSTSTGALFSFRLWPLLVLDAEILALLSPNRQLLITGNILVDRKDRLAHRLHWPDETRVANHAATCAHSLILDSLTQPKHVSQAEQILLSNLAMLTADLLRIQRLVAHGALFKLLE